MVNTSLMIDNANTDAKIIASLSFSNATVTSAIHQNTPFFNSSVRGGRMTP